jgi:hypothetical protein
VRIRVLGPLRAGYLASSGNVIEVPDALGERLVNEGAAERTDDPVPPGRASGDGLPRVGPSGPAKRVHPSRPPYRVSLDVLDPRSILERAQSAPAHRRIGYLEDGDQLGVAAHGSMWRVRWEPNNRTYVRY